MKLFYSWLFFLGTLSVIAQEEHVFFVDEGHNYCMLLPGDMIHDIAIDSVTFDEFNIFKKYNTEGTKLRYLLVVEIKKANDKLVISEEEELEADLGYDIFDMEKTRVGGCDALSFNMDYEIDGVKRYDGAGFVIFGSKTRALMVILVAYIKGEDGDAIRQKIARSVLLNI